MTFTLPPYTAPDFDAPELKAAPLARFEPVVKDAVAPDNYHASSIFPEYIQVEPGQWVLLENSRMDCVVVKRPDDTLDVVEFRRLKVGDLVAVGRTEDGEEGILVHTTGFSAATAFGEKFAFRTQLTRESSFSIDYDELYDQLRYERDNGFILWVGGPAIVFDSDARKAFVRLVEEGYVQALLAGNALATHDIEGALYKTSLGQGIYDKAPAKLGHYNHLDAINTIKKAGGIRAAVDSGLVGDGVMHALTTHDVPYVLASSIRDDGPLPEVVRDAYAAQDAMREHACRATSVITMATQLHSIAVGNMTPSYQVTEDGGVRPVYFSCVDMSEFAASKLANRGSLTVRSMLTNVQDFVVTLSRALTGPA